MKKYLKNTAFYSGIIALVSGIGLWFFLNARYGGIWFADGGDRFYFLIYILGWYGGWLFILISIAALLVYFFNKIFGKPKRQVNLPVFYLLFGIYVQVVFWAETYNFYHFANYRSDLRCILAYLTVFAIISLLFCLFYRILKKTSVFKVGNSVIKFGSVILFPLMFLLFIGSIIIPEMPGMRVINSQMKEPKPNYDSEGNYIGNDSVSIEKKYNILLISLDTVGGDDLGCYGNPLPVSPFIDSLADEGVLFRNTYAVSPWTLPSHGSIFTSLYPSQHGAIRKLQPDGEIDRLSQGNITIAEILKSAGYSTHAYTGGGYVSGSLGFSQGFDVYEDLDEGISFERASEFLNNYESDNPFFLFMHTYIAHNYNPLPEYETMFCDTTLSWMKNKIMKEMVTILSIKTGYFQRHPEYIEYLENLYYATIRQVDDCVKGIMAVLRKQDLYDNTVIIILSDHGEEFFEHGGFGHGESYYEEMMRVPLIMVLPEDFNCSGLVVEDRVCLLDILPTILDLTGLPELGFCEGMSILPAIRGQSLPERVLYFEAEDAENKLGMLDKDNKYIFNGMPPLEKRFLPNFKFQHYLSTIIKYKGEEYYDLQSDVDEVNNVYYELSDDLRVKLRKSTIESYLTRYNEFLENKINDNKSLTEEELERLHALGYVH